MTRLGVWGPRAGARPEPSRHNGERVSQFEWGKKKEKKKNWELGALSGFSGMNLKGEEWMAGEGFDRSDSARSQEIDYNLRQCVTFSLPEADKMEIAPFSSSASPMGLICLKIFNLQPRRVKPTKACQ